MSSRSHFLKKALISAFFVFLCSCSNAGNRWKYDEIFTDAGRYATMYMPPQNAYRDIEVEIQISKDNPIVYLNIYSTPLTTTENKNVQVLIKAEAKTISISGYVLEGGHRIYLDTHSALSFIELLKENESVSISIDKYSCVVHQKDFLESYNQLNR